MRSVGSNWVKLDQISTNRNKSEVFLKMGPKTKILFRDLTNFNKKNILGYLEIYLLAPCLMMFNISSLPKFCFCSAKRPCWITILSKRNLTPALSTIFSSTVFSVTNRNTRTCFFWPIRWALELRKQKTKFKNRKIVKS